MSELDGFRAGPSSDVPEGTLRLYEVAGRQVGVLRILGQLRAYENHCPHQGGPACQGDLLGRQEAMLDERRRVVGERLSDERYDVICPWHGYSFDALTGECVGDRRLRLRRREVAERDGWIHVWPARPT